MKAEVVNGKFYCSQISQQAEEDLFGTGGAEHIWILLEYQKPWGRDAVEDSDLSDDLIKFIRDLKDFKRNISFVFIKKNSIFLRPFKLFIIFPHEHLSISHEVLLDSYDDLLNLDIRRLQKGEISLTSRVIDEPFHLVCTHGKRDKCCAKFGFETFKRMAALSADDVWQCSHVGGDRFAANVVSFPHGIYYGHVAVTDAEEIIDSTRLRNIVLKNYRGRSCYSRQGQAAEYFIRKTLDVMDIDDITLESIEQRSGDVWTARMRHISARKGFTIIFTRSLSSAENFLTCRATVKKPTEVYTLKSFQMG